MDLERLPILVEGDVTRNKWAGGAAGYQLLQRYFSPANSEVLHIPATVLILLKTSQSKMEEMRMHLCVITG